MEFATADNPKPKKEICLVTKPRYGHNQEICLCSNELKNFIMPQNIPNSHQISHVVKYKIYSTLSS